MKNCNYLTYNLKIYPIVENDDSILIKNKIKKTLFKTSVGASLSAFRKIAD
jgi:hypothetical protein